MREGGQDTGASQESDFPVVLVQSGSSQELGEIVYPLPRCQRVQVGILGSCGALPQQRETTSVPCVPSSVLPVPPPVLPVPPRWHCSAGHQGCRCQEQSQLETGATAARDLLQCPPSEGSLLLLPPPRTRSPGSMLRRDLPRSPERSLGATWQRSGFSAEPAVGQGRSLSWTGDALPVSEAAQEALSHPLRSSRGLPGAAPGKALAAHTPP